jgi:hypothetical protein
MSNFKYYENVGRVPQVLYLADKNIVDPGSAYLGVDAGYEVRRVHTIMNYGLGAIFGLLLLALISMGIYMYMTMRLFRNKGWDEIQSMVQYLQPDTVIGRPFHNAEEQYRVEETRYAFAISNGLMAICFLSLLFVFTFIYVQRRKADIVGGYAGGEADHEADVGASSATVTAAGVLIGLSVAFVLVWNAFTVAGYEVPFMTIRYHTFEGISIVIALVVMTFIMYAVFRGLLDSRDMVDQKFLAAFGIMTMAFAILAVVRGGS